MAISTTGDPHRIHLLQQCVRSWKRCLPFDSPIFVTVDGDENATRIVSLALAGLHRVYRVGQRALDPRHHPITWYAPETGERLGVAANKNTGIELLMDTAEDVEHLFLSDDDTWPLFPQSLDKHIALNRVHDVRHSMVCWGRHRLERAGVGYAEWSWPRGVVTYTRRVVVETVGGMIEEFGPGGHEHVEWSQRIYNAGLTPDRFCSPASYATRDAMGARALWHAEDMPRAKEPRHVYAKRKADLTSVRTTPEDWQRIDRLMAECEGRSDFVDYRAQSNGRSSATLSPSNNPSLGAEESK